MSLILDISPSGEFDLTDEHGLHHEVKAATLATVAMRMLTAQHALPPGHRGVGTAASPTAAMIAHLTSDPRWGNPAKFTPDGKQILPNITLEDLDL